MKKITYTAAAALVTYLPVIANADAVIEVPEPSVLALFASAAVALFVANKLRR